MNKIRDNKLAKSKQFKARKPLTRKQRIKKNRLAFKQNQKYSPFDDTPEHHESFA